MHQSSDFRNPPDTTPILQVMPWPVYGKMSDRELEAIPCRSLGLSSLLEQRHDVHAVTVLRYGRQAPTAPGTDGGLTAE